ncbi:MAG: Flp family type IVb pilin [Alphaproteobacteria bacterium]|nr:Flp family type IVb pilin [Alphaproteobacteria bacterium]
MVKKMLAKLHSDILGATSIEYGLIIAGIGIAVVMSFFLLGDRISGVFTYLSEILVSRTPS